MKVTGDRLQVTGHEEQRTGLAEEPSVTCHLSPVTSRCVTCSDEALPATVLRVDQETGLALVAVNDTTTEVDITLVDTVAPGDQLLVHGGVAIAKL